MLPSNELFVLIQSMSKAEKRHFKLISTQHSKTGESNYIKLFDAIDKQKEYDEDKIRRKFADQAFGKKLAATKYLLYELILKGLRNFHSGRTVDSKICNMLEEIELLFNKGLYKQGKKVLSRAKKLAKESEKHFLLHRLLMWEKKIMTYLAPKKLANSLKNILDEANEVSNYLNSEIQFQEMLDKAIFLYRTCMNPDVPCDKNCLNMIMEQPIMQDVAQAPTFKAKLCYYEIHSIYARIKKDFKAAFDSLNAIKELFDAQLEKIDGHRSTYQRIMVDLINCGLQAGVSFSYKGVIEDLKELPTVNELDRSKQEMLVTSLEINYFLHTKQLNKCAPLVCFIEKTKDQTEQLLDKVDTIKLYCHVGIYYFLTKNYDKCVDWLDKVQDFDKTGLYPSMMAFCRLLQLPVQYELENYTYLEYQLRATQRYLRKKQQFGTLESLILRHIKKCLDSTTKREAMGILAELLTSIENLPQHEMKMLPLGEKAINYWLNTKLRPNQMTAERQLAPKFAFAG